MATAQRTDRDTKSTAVFRMDAVELSPLVEQPNGFARGEARCTRTGVFVYRFADGTEQRELRHPEDVFAPESVASLQMVPICDGHPEGDVTIDNAGDLIRGYVGSSVSIDGQRFLRSDILLTDRAVIDGVKAGRNQVSCGYTSDVVEEVGEYEGEAYDARQRNIRYNHLAANIVQGRAGPDVKIRTDRRDAICVGRPQANDTNERRCDGVEEQPMTVPATLRKIRVHKIDVDVSEPAAQAIEAEIAEHKAKIAELEKKLGEMAGAVDASKAVAAEATKQADAAKGKADELTAQIATIKAERGDEKKVHELARARAKLLSVAGDVLDAKAAKKLDAMTDDEIRKAVVLAVNPKANLEGKSAEYVAARFDMAIETLKESPIEGRDVRDAREDEGEREDAADVDDEDMKRFDSACARNDYHSRTFGAWKNKTTDDDAAA